MRHCILTLLFILLVGCHKNDHDNYNTYHISELPTLEEQQEETKLFTRQIVQNYIILKDIILLTFRQAIFNPELLGMFIDPDQAQVRACPTADPLVGSFPGTVEMTLDFGGAAGCTTSGLSPNENMYTGSIKGEFKTELFMSVSGEEFTLSTCGFSINGYELGDVNIEFYKQSNNNYDIKLLDDLVVTKGNIKTTITKNTGSQRFGVLKYVADGNDMNDDPTTFLDNEYNFSVTDEIVTCENTTTMTSNAFCVDTSIDMNIQPMTCGCMRDGRLRISNAGDCNNPHTTYDFDATMSGANPNPGECDEYVEETTSTGTVNLQMDSC